MEYLYRKKIIILLLLCIISCKPHLSQENVYEILISCTYQKNGNDFFRGSDIRLDLIAVEKERDSVLQQHYPVHWRILGEDILNEGLDACRNTLVRVNQKDCTYSILKKDFNHIFYIGGYEIDLTKGQNTVFLRSFLEKEYSWTIDSIPLCDLTSQSVILVEPNYGLYINDSIYIPHASKLISEIAGHFETLKYTFIYDRNRQIIVSSEVRGLQSNDIRLKHELIKVIKLTRDEFYSFWKEPDLIIPEKGSEIWDNDQYIIYPMY